MVIERVDFAIASLLPKPRYRQECCIERHSVKAER
jgi:hypothetical protein